jgi:hypothetical protein
VRRKWKRIDDERWKENPFGDVMGLLLLMAQNHDEYDERDGFFHPFGPEITKKVDPFGD